MPEYMYGIREDGSVVSINDITLSEVGLLCKCKCPQCRRDLQACSLLGSNKKSRYFRHHNEGYNREGIDNLYGCTATSANESGLHMMAKELIAETRRIAFPSMNLSVDRLGLQYGDEILAQLPQSIPLRSGFIFECNEVVEIEKPYPQFRPDVSVSGNGETFLIEIAVTHRVDVDKQEKVQKYGLPMLEIDLIEYVESGISRDALRKIITEEIKHKQWISFAKDMVDSARKSLTVQADSIKKRLDDIRKQREEIEQRRRGFFVPNVYASTLNVNCNDYAFEQYVKKELHFKANRYDYPFFIDIPISGEVLFRCDRRVWQGQIFDRWVYNRRTDSDYINLLKIWDCLKDDHKIPFNPALEAKFEYPGVDEPKYLPYEVIRKYLGYLEQLGFIDINGKGATVLEKHSTIPPCQEYANQLKTAMQQIGGCSPLSSAHLDQKIEELQRAKREYEAEIQRKRASELREQKEKRRKAEQVLEEARRREEMAKQAEEKALQQEENAIRKEMQQADYDQNDYIVYDCKNRRWTKCKFCQKAVLFSKDELSSFDSTAMNKGICYNCRFRF